MSEMGLWNVWVGKPSILRDEDVGTRWVGPPWLPWDMVLAVILIPRTGRE